MSSRLVADVVLDAGASLGELPRWCATRQRLLWLDVDRGMLHETDPHTGQDTQYAVGAGVGALAPVDRAHVGIATRDSFLLADLDGASQNRLARLPTRTGEILNDGACDPAGRFWAGTYMHGERVNGGRLYCMDTDRRVHIALPHVTLSNGLGWSPDHKFMYYIDSQTQRVDMFNYDLGTGAITLRRPHVLIPRALGQPDGLAIDHEGALWVAMWGGAQVRRYTPEGQLDRVIELPTDHVTSCAFGGTGGDTLLITTAAGYLDERRRQSQPHAGALFAVATGVTGPPAHPVTL